MTTNADAARNATVNADRAAQATATEADLRTALHDAMDGNLRQSRRRALLDDYRAAILTNAGLVVLDDNARGFLRFALDTAVSRLTEDGTRPLSAEDMPAVVVLRKLAGGEAS